MSITPEDVEDIYELSSTQQGILFDTLYSAVPGTYLVQSPVTLRGPLDPDALQAAWRIAIDSNAALRTSFHWESLEKPLQVVRRHAEPIWHDHDWRQIPAAEQQTLLAEYLRDDRAAGFDVSRAPLMRFAMFRLGHDTYKLVVTSHHLILDGWSKSLLFGDVFSAYDALSNGSRPEQPGRRPYRDFIAWLQQQDPGNAERYWRGALRKLAEPTRVPDLCEERAHSVVAADRFAEERLRLTAAETAALIECGRRHSCTLGTLMLGAWAVLLSRYGGQRTVMFGATTAGRPWGLPGFEQMVGLFISTPPAVVTIQPDERVVSWLQRLQREQAEAREYAHTPLVALRTWSNIPPSEPLFDSIVVVENYPAGGRAASFGGVTVSRDPSVERARFPLSVLVTPSREMPIKAIYDTSRFDCTAIRRLLNHYRTILGAIAADRNERVGSLPILNEDEQAQIRASWRGAQRPHQDTCIHDLFESQVRRTPDALALSHGSEHLTYANLDERANQMAQYLRRGGVGPEVPVGLCLERGPALIVAMLGIWKAGGVVVPLDPNYPEKRLSFMIAASGAQWLVTDERVRQRLPISAARAVHTDRDEALLRQERSSPVQADVGSRNLAYVIFTSGSTGQPKGVAVEHRGLCNVVEAQRDFGLGTGDRMLQFASLSFDASVFEICMALTAGATLVLLPQDSARLGTRLFELVTRGEITAATLPPSVAATLPEAEASALRVLTVAGEACPLDLVRRWAPGRRFWNLYGPTEYTIWATSSECLPQSTRVSIGRPIPNTAAYVVDRDLNALPVRVPGELCLSGVGLARGYLGRADLTAERFVPDPFGDVAGARMYRTGDRARLLDNGEIEFRGRDDHQVKIRGFRIELAEIEAAIESHPAVCEAVVVVRDEGAGSRIAAYWKSSTAAPVDPAELRAWLSERLPTYMVPEAFVRMTEWPLTLNGKIDRHALPEPDTGRSLRLEPTSAPQTAVERELGDLWRNVLGLPHIGVEENFFDVGGNSLLVLRLYGMLRPGHGDRLSIVDFFSFPTIRTMAGHLSRHADPQPLHASQARAAYRRASLAQRRSEPHV